MSNAPNSPDDDIEALASDCDLVELVIRPRLRDLGGGFKVRRILPFHKRRMVGPFIFFDHFGPVSYAPGEGFDVRPHPHIGLATVTYLFEGAIAHKDNIGSDLVIRPGAVNWMTAGRGIVHSERTPPEERAAGQNMHGIQTWVALPVSHEQSEPAFEHHSADSLPVFDLGGARMRLIAGEAWGHVSPVQFPHPIWYLAGETASGAALHIPADAARERAVYVAEGEVALESETLMEGSMAVLSEDCEVPLIAAPGTRFLLAGGAPMPEKRLIYWNLVASDQSLIDQAKAGWKASIEGRFQDTAFSLPDGETEWIPAPE